MNDHFGGKAGALRAVVSDVAEEMLARIEQAVAAQGSTHERTRALARDIVESVDAAPYAPRLMVEQILFAGSTTSTKSPTRWHTISPSTPPS